MAITIKTKEEVAILREGGKRHAQIMKKLIDMVKPGITTNELDQEAARLVKEGGDTAAFLDYMPYGADRPYPATLCVSLNDEVVHGIPNEVDRVLKEGDIVSLDLGLVHKGMFTDMAVTVPVGKISIDAQKLLDTTKEALMLGIKAAKGGKNVGDIGEAVERHAIPHGYGVVEELAGHGVGYGVHEDPYVPNYGEKGKGAKLKPGMVIAIEPMFNIGTKDITLDKDGYTYRTADGSLSAHFEHTILITKGDPEILTV